MTVEQTTTRRPTPGILLARPRRDRRHPRLWQFVGFGALTALGLGLSVWEAASGFPYVVRFYRLVDVPGIVVFAAVTLIGIGGLVAARRKPVAPWYQPWSFVEFCEEEDGLRVFAGRNGAAGFLVRPGQTLRVDATGRRQGSAKVYVLSVSSDTGEHAMTMGWAVLGRLTMVPLVEAARARGIDVVRYGDAGRIAHPAPAGE